MLEHQGYLVSFVYLHTKGLPLEIVSFHPLVSALFGALVEGITAAPRSHPYYIPAFAILRMIYEFFPEI
jgi:hypothetical protein